LSDRLGSTKADRYFLKLYHPPGLIGAVGGHSASATDERPRSRAFVALNDCRSRRIYLAWSGQFPTLSADASYVLLRSLLNAA
jgi:hypothetical protein